MGYAGYEKRKRRRIKIETARDLKPFWTIEHNSNFLLSLSQSFAAHNRLNRRAVKSAN